MQCFSRRSTFSDGDVKAEIYFYDSVNPWSRSCLNGLVFIYGTPTVVSVVKHLLKKKMAADQTPYMVVFVHKSCLFDFFLSYREIDTVQCKNPIIVTEK